MSLRSLFIAASLFLASPVATAGQVDPLWLAASEPLRAMRDLVAGDVNANTVVTGENGKNLDTIKKSSKLTGWRDGEPVRTTVKMVTSQGSGLGELKFEEGIVNQSVRALADVESVVRAGPATLEGKTLVLFNVAGMQKKHPFTAKVWIDEASKLPVRADYAIKASSMAKSMTYTAVFGRDEQARWLPLTVDVDATVSALFFQFRVQSALQLSNWIKRP